MIFLVMAGLVAGFIDSIAGGGGLITVPVFSLHLGPGSLAIGKNKVAAVTSSAIALWVYFRAGHIRLTGNRRFAILAALGAIGGAQVSPFVDPSIYKWMIVFISPIMLFLVFKKDLWIARTSQPPPISPQKWILWGAGILCGFYDGIAGPGGGTLMFLSLFVFARLPLLASMATAKVANLATATTSLSSFIYTGHVVWSDGLIVAAGIGIGAYLGASFATRWAAPLARGVLLIVSSILILRLIFT